VATLEHHAERLVDQRSDVVHARMLELADRLRDEMPPVEPGTQAATMLRMTGPVGIEVTDRGPNRIELRTTEGRVRVEAAADLTPTEDGKTSLSLGLVVQPQGFAANMMLGVALRTMPNVERQLIDGLERALTDLAAELAKPDGEWDARAWQPPGLPTRS
jgi:hypothetical protein